MNLDRFLYRVVQFFSAVDPRKRGAISVSNKPKGECRKCKTELTISAAATKNGRTRTHSIGFRYPDGRQGRFIVTLCPNCYAGLAGTGALDSYAEKELALTMAPTKG